MNVDEENNTTLNDAAKQILTTQNALKNKKIKLRQEINSSSERVAKSRGAHYDKESKLRKRKFKLAGELQNWILKYDQDMGWRQVRYYDSERYSSRYVPCSLILSNLYSLLFFNTSLKYLDHFYNQH